MKLRKRQQNKRLCMYCQKYPAKHSYGDESGRADVCGYCLHRLYADAKAGLRITEAAAIVIDPDAWEEAE